MDTASRQELPRWRVSLFCLSQVRGVVSQWFRYRASTQAYPPSDDLHVSPDVVLSFPSWLNLTSLYLPFFYLVSSSHSPPCLGFSSSSSPSYLSLLPLFFSPSFTLQPFFVPSNFPKIIHSLFFFFNSRHSFIWFLFVLDYGLFSPVLYTYFLSNHSRLINYKFELFEVARPLSRILLKSSSIRIEILKTFKMKHFFTSAVAMAAVVAAFPMGEYLI